jgi:hypothetical protein
LRNFSIKAADPARRIMQNCGLWIASRSLHRSTKTWKFAAIAADPHNG